MVCQVFKACLTVERRLLSTNYQIKHGNSSYLIMHHMSSTFMYYQLFALLSLAIRSRYIINNNLFLVLLILFLADSLFSCPVLGKYM